MAYSNTVKNGRLQVVADLVAGKTLAAATGSATAGKLVIGTSALSGATGVLCTIDLPTTPFSIASGVATLLGVPLSGTAILGGTAAKAELRDNAGTVIRGGLTVGLTGTDVIIASTSIVLADTVRVTALTITHE